MSAVDAACSAADEVLPRGTALEALAGWAGALVLGAGFWGAVAAVVARG